MSEETAEETVVIFRKWRGKPHSVMALMPELASSYNGHYCDAYEHAGQHGGADYHGVIDQTRAASPEEYADLKAELESEPYNYRFAVKQRATSAMHEKRREKARQYREGTDLLYEADTGYRTIL